MGTGELSGLNYKESNAVLFGMYHRTKNPYLRTQIANRIVENNIGIMYRQIYGALRKLPPNLQCTIRSMGVDEILDEVVLITLKNGIRNYDPEKGPFPPYMARIVGQATRKVIDQIRPFHVPRQIVYIREKIKDMHGSEPGELPSNPDTIREIARGLKVDQTQVRNALRLPKRTAETSYMTTGNVDSHRDPDSVTQEVMDSQRREKIKELLETATSRGILNKGDLTVLDRKFGLGLGYYERKDGRGIEQTDVDIAKRLGFSNERVRQRKERGLGALGRMEELRELASSL